MGDIDDYILFFIIPAILGATRWGFWFFWKYIPSLFYKPKPVPENPTLTPNDATIVVPIYQPDKKFFIPCLRAWLATGARVLLVADQTCYDDVNQWAINLAEQGEGAAEVINEEKPGKRVAMFNGLQRVNTEVLVFADDDSLWDPDVLPSILAAFEDPKIAGCSTRQLVQPKGDKKTLTESIADIYLALRETETKATVNMCGYSACLSGRTMAYRTEVLRRDGFEEHFLNDRFLGQLQNSGDDKSLTRWIYKQDDVKMFSQVIDKCTITTTFLEGTAYLKQTVRWSRNTWRSDLKTIFTIRSMWCKGFWLCCIMVDRLISPFSLLSGAGLAVYGTVMVGGEMEEIKNIGWIFFSWLAWVHASRGFKLLHHFRRVPREIWVLPFYIAGSYFSACVRIYALLTIYDRSWGNRDVKVNKNNEIVRTDAASKKAREVKIVEVPETEI